MEWTIAREGSAQFSASNSHHLFPLGQKYPMSTTHQAQRILPSENWNPRKVFTTTMAFGLGSQDLMMARCCWVSFFSWGFKSCFFKVYIWQHFQLFLSQDSWGFITVHMLIMFPVSADDEENITHNSQFCDMHQICWMVSCYSMGSSNHLEHIDNFLRVCSFMLQYHVAAARIAWQMGRGNTKRKSVTRDSQCSIGNFRVFRSDKDHTRLAPFTNGHNCQAFQKRKTIWDGFLLGNPKTDLTSLLSFLAVSWVRYYPRPSKTRWTFYKGPQCLHSEKCIRGLLAVSFMFIQAVSCWTYIENLWKLAMKSASPCQKPYYMAGGNGNLWIFVGPTEDQGQLPSIRWVKLLDDFLVVQLSQFYPS